MPISAANMPPGPVATSPTPAATPMPQGPVNVNTPLHAAVRANPSITPAQIVDLHSQLVPKGAPLLSAQGAAIVKQQALSPSAGANIAASAPMSTVQGPFNAGGPAPNALGPNMAAANANRLGTTQTAIDGPAPTPQPAGPMPMTPPAPATAPAAAIAPVTAGSTPEAGSFTQAQPVSPAAIANAKPPSTAPGAQPSHPSWLQSLGNTLVKAAPLIAGAVIGGSNPGAGAAALNGWQQGTQQAQQRQAQQQAVARDTAQQTLENQRQAAHDTAATTQQELENQQKADEDRTAFYDSLKGLSSASQEERVKALTPEEAKRIGVDPATFYDKDGKFVPQTAQDTAKGLHAIFSTFKTVKDAYDYGLASGLTADTNPDMAVLASKLGSADADPNEINPFWNKQQTGNNAANNDIKADTAEIAARRAFSQFADQQSILDKYKDDPEGFKAEYHFDKPDQPLKKESDVLHEQGLTETARHHGVNEQQGNRRLTLGEAALKVKASHDKAMELIGQSNARSHAISANAGQARADNQKIYEAWKMNGGATADQKSKSMYNSPWGTVFDKAQNALDAANNKLQAWKDQQALLKLPTTNPPAALVDPVVRLNAQVQRMNTTKPPSVRSQAYAGKQVYKPSDMKTIGGVTQSIAAWRQYYRDNRPGQKLPF